MVSKQKILIVDDDNNIAELIALYLTKECFETKIVNDGEEALREFASFRPDLIILDLMLPGIDGYQVCREIRHTSDVPIIMLSAKGETFDKVLGLELGAADYMIKPFDSKELVARVRAVLRRFQVKQPSPSSSEKCVTYPDLTVNLTNYSVTYMGRQVDMPPKELELLYFLAASPNQVFTREQLLDHIWGYEYIGDTRTVDVHIKRLREKIKDHASWAITTVWGIANKIEVKKGDVVMVKAGTIHAIGAGIFICEIQQNSNCTYRMYDYDRRDKFGNPRELHIAKSLDVVNPVKYEKDNKCNVMLAHNEHYMSKRLVQCKYFEVIKYDIEDDAKIPVDEASFLSVIVIDGEGSKVICKD